VRRGLGRPGAAPDKIEEAKKLLDQGLGILKVAKQVGLGTGTVQMLKREVGSAGSWRAAWWTASRFLGFLIRADERRHRRARPMPALTRSRMVARSALELGEGAGYMEEQLAGGRGGIDVLLQEVEVDANTGARRFATGR
jgi:hypothetical protein